MTTVLNAIPTHLQHEVDAALSWFNARAESPFEVTGIVDPPATAGADQDLRLILCGANSCRQETFRVSGSATAPQVAWLGDAQTTALAKVAELDPPPGARRQWIDAVAAQHAFVVLLFYRGFW